MKRKIQAAWLLLATVLLGAHLTACSNVKEMIGKVESSGKVRAGELKRVAVLPFDGPHGGVMADRVSYELLDRGAAVITRQKINFVLKQRDLLDAGFDAQRDRQQLAELAEALEADVLITGSVALLDDADTLVDQARGVPGFKVKTASLQLTRAADLAELASARYGSEREMALLAATYHDVAYQMVEAVVVE